MPDAATAEIYLQGAHVTRWQPAAAEHPVIFLSEKSQFTAGKAIRGGVPLVFPWFAERKGGLPGGMHGFARTLPWEVVATEQRAEGARPDVVRADQPQAVEPLGVGEMCAVGPLVHAGTASLNRNVRSSVLVLLLRTPRLRKTGAKGPIHDLTCRSPAPYRKG